MYAQHIYWRAEMHNTLYAHNIFTEQVKQNAIYVTINMAYISTYDCWFVLKIVKYTLQGKEYLNYGLMSL